MIRRVSMTSGSAEEPIDKAGLVQFSNEAIIDELCHVHIADARVLCLDVSLYVAQSCRSGIGLSRHISNKILVSFFRGGLIRDPEPLHDELQDRSVVFWRNNVCETFEQRFDDVFHRLRLFRDVSPLSGDIDAYERDVGSLRVA